MVHDGFVYLRPSKDLEPYVRHYWLFRSAEQLSTMTFPIGCPQIIFHRGNPLFVPELDSPQHRVSISGQVNYPSHLCSDGRLDMVVVVFRPHSLASVLGMPASEFFNQEMNGVDIANRSFDALSARISECDDINATFDAIESWVKAQLKTNIFDSLHRRGGAGAAVLNFRRIDAALQQMFISPSIPIAELASVSCLGTKQFERLFSHSIGMNPKEYAGIVRFQKALWLMQTGNTIDFPQVAYASGYADQSHFIREFRKYSSCTPTALIKQHQPYSDLFSNPASKV